MSHPSSLLRRLKGLTLVELLIAVSIIAIISSLAVIDFGQSQKTARDSRRKDDIRAVASAVSAYQVANSTLFITMAGQLCTVTAPADPTVMASGTGCTGALGRSYGKINFSRGVANLSLTTRRRYADNSIVDGLHSRGFLGTVPHDPLTHASDNTSTMYDYVLVECCNDGTQSISGKSALFAVWTRLENQPPTQVDTSNASRYCGGSNAGPSVGYQYDFATDPSGFKPYGIGIGNGITGATQSKADTKPGSCQA